MKMRYCTNCLMPSTRPRIRFNEQGVCNACAWAEEKSRTIDWTSRWKDLEQLCDRFRNHHPDGFNCIVPVSGGKDSSYIAHRIKHDLGMRPLCVTVNPPIPLPVGEQNVKNLAASGFDIVAISPNEKIMRQLNCWGFREQGRPMIAWMMTVQSALFRAAVLHRIPLVMFAEEGETEYGGTGKISQAFAGCYDADYAVAVYLEGNNAKQFSGMFSEAELYWWRFPPESELRQINPMIAHWSYFEDWDPYQHYLVAKEHCGLQEMEERCPGTYNNFAQTDSYIFDFHIYLMYLKFGFGRCTADVGIDIRRGAMTRSQALALVKRYDGEIPEPHVFEMLRDYYGMTMEEFVTVLDRHANKELFRKEGNRWVPLFTPE